MILTFLFRNEDGLDQENVTNSSQSLQSVIVDEDDSARLIQKKRNSKSKPGITTPSISNVAALFVKNWITMKRNLPLLFFVFFHPGIVLLINSVTVGLSPRNLPIAVVNLESSCSDKYYQTKCEATQLGCYTQQSLNSMSGTPRGTIEFFNLSISRFYTFSEQVNFKLQTRNYT